VSASLAITRDQASRHEAGHVGLLHCLGVRVGGVDIIDHGHRHGFTQHKLRVTSPSTAEAQAKHTIASWICEGNLPVWPLDSGVVTSNDERHLAAIAREYGWTEDNWRRLVKETCEIMSGPTFRQAYEAICGALQTTSALDRATIKRLLTPAPAVERMTLPTTIISIDGQLGPAVQYKGRAREADRATLLKRLERLEYQVPYVLARREPLDALERGRQATLRRQTMRQALDIALS
jgi:hypothetical protein